MAKQKQTKINFPQAREENVVVESVGDETVIYDLEAHVAHALNPLASAVYMYANGERNGAEIAELAGYRLGTTVSEADVAEAIVQLEAISMITAPVLDVRSGLSRRQALKTFAAAGAGSVLVMSVATSAASACYTCGSPNTPGLPTSSQSCVTPGSLGKAGIGDCTICQTDSQCGGSDSQCVCAPCGQNTDCCQPVCIVGNKIPSGYGYLPLAGNPGAGATISCPSGYYQYRELNPGILPPFTDSYTLTYACCNLSSQACKESHTGGLCTSQL